jgi:NADP-dependent 3-hydroxy acid dehydrogenase YdfG
MKDKVVVVTGASGGIGAAVAEHVAGKGARVVLAARREKELADVASRCGASSLAVATDVRRRADVERVVRATIDRFGHVDVWVNNAGRAISRMPSELTDADIDEMVLVNLKSMLYGVQAVLPHFKERGKGHIVNVSTMLARVPFAPFRSMYTASKAAVNSLSSGLRAELRGAHPGIFVSVVHPGIVKTDLGLNALHGGVDNHKLPGAQEAGEVAVVIGALLEAPRADVYTREGSRKLVADYYGAEDMGEIEKRPPYTR